MSRIATLAAKDLRILWRDKFGLFWILVFPLLFALFFGAIFSGGREGSRAAMKVGLVDLDRSEKSERFAKELVKSKAVELTPLSEPQARDDVRRGKLTGFVVLREGFGKSSGFFSGNAPAIDLGIDPARQAEGGYLEGLVTQASFALMKEEFTDAKAMRENLRQSKERLDRDPDLAPDRREKLKKFFGDLDDVLGSADLDGIGAPPSMDAARVRRVDVAPDRIGPRSAFEITFPSAVLWGVLGCAAGFAIGLVIERKAGTLLRLRVSPLSRGHILAGKALGCFIACSAVALLLLGVGRLIFGVRISSPGLLAVAVLSTAAAFVGIMMLMSVLGKTEQSVAGAGWAILTVMAMLGGGMVPLIAMPAWMQTASHVSPVKWGIVALEGAIWRGFSPSDMALPCAILWGIGLLGFGVGVRIFSKFEA